LRQQAFAVDIGGTNTVVALISNRGVTRILSRFSTKGQSVLHLVERIGKALESCDQFSQDLRVGVGAPNANFERGTVEYPPNLDWDEITPLASMLKTRTGLETRVINDADAAAIGEGAYGDAVGFKHFIVVTLGTGIGAGIVCNGRLIRGARGTAGDLGHVLVESYGLPCRCGRTGCLETLVSAKALTLNALAILCEQAGTGPLAENSSATLSAMDVYDAAESGDPCAIESFERLAEPLGRALANAVTLFGPEKIILTGGLTMAGAQLLEPTRRFFRENLRWVDRGQIELSISTLPEGAAALLGAARLAMSDDLPWLSA
jgi:glucokinase